jgi:hypothetical protein
MIRNRPYCLTQETCPRFARCNYPIAVNPTSRCAPATQTATFPSCRESGWASRSASAYRDRQSRLWHRACANGRGSRRSLSLSFPFDVESGRRRLFLPRGRFGLDGVSVALDALRRDEPTPRPSCPARFESRFEFVDSFLNSTSPCKPSRECDGPSTRKRALDILRHSTKRLRKNRAFRVELGDARTPRSTTQEVDSLVTWW